MRSDCDSATGDKDLRDNWSGNRHERVPARESKATETIPSNKGIELRDLISANEEVFPGGGNGLFLKDDDTDLDFEFPLDISKRHKISLSLYKSDVHIKLAVPQSINLGAIHSSASRER